MKNFRRYRPQAKAASLHQSGRPACHGQNDAGTLVFARKQINGCDFEGRLRIFNGGQAEEQRVFSIRRERRSHPGDFGIVAGGAHYSFAAWGVKVEGVNSVSDCVGRRF
ncbi:MAG TPA: hypothetical protein VF430_08780, partial [Verrucomicrobiae bacterium]